MASKLSSCQGSNEVDRPIINFSSGHCSDDDFLVRLDLTDVYEVTERTERTGKADCVKFKQKRSNFRGIRDRELELELRISKVACTSQYGFVVSHAPSMAHCLHFNLVTVFHLFAGISGNLVFQLRQ